MEGSSTLWPGSGAGPGRSSPPDLHLRPVRKNCRTQVPTPRHSPELHRPPWATSAVSSQPPQLLNRGGIPCGPASLVSRSPLCDQLLALRASPSSSKRSRCCRRTVAVPLLPETSPAKSYLHPAYRSTDPWTSGMRSRDNINSIHTRSLQRHLFRDPDYEPACRPKPCHKRVWASLPHESSQAQEQHCGGVRLGVVGVRATQSVAFDAAEAICLW